MLEEKGLDEVVRALAAATGGAVCVLSGRGEHDRLAPSSGARCPPAPSSRCARRCSAGARGSARRGRVRARPPGDRRALARAARVHARARLPAGLAARGARLRRARGLRAADPPAGRDRGGARADAPARDARHRAAPGRRRAGGGAHRTAVAGGAAHAAAPVRRGRRAPPCSSSRATTRRAPRPRPSSTASSRRPACPALVAPRERLLCAVLDGREGLDPVALAEQRLRRARGARAARAAGRRVAVGVRWARSATASTRRAARSRPPRWPTATRGAWPRYRDLGAFQLILSLQDEEVLRLYCDSVLGPLEGASGRVRRRADPLARDLHRAERPMGDGRSRAVLPPPYAALSDTTRGAADGPRPVERPGSDRVLARAEGARAGESMRRDRETR